MCRIAVCICTFERTKGLRELLRGLDAQRLVSLSKADIRVVIVDNSATTSAQMVFDEYEKSGRFSSTFVHDPRRGLSNVRNRAVEHVLEVGADYLAFIDDDEVPTPDWIEHLVAEARRTAAAAVVGPVAPIFEVPPPSWAVFQGFYAKAPAMRDGHVTDGYTSNCLVSCRVLDEKALRFDPRFNATGGEDTWFFKCLLDAGGTIAFAERAVVMEYVPPARMTPGWLLKRWYRTGSVEAALCPFEPSSSKGRLINVLKGSTRLVGGVSMFFVALALSPWCPSGAVFARCYTICRGLGLLTSVVGVVYREYTANDYRRI
jgi:succinoglycan biosynthesis protein ExoM